MLGFALHRMLHDAGHDVVGVVRSVHPALVQTLAGKGLRHLEGVDVARFGESVFPLLEAERADVVVNATGLLSTVDGGALLCVNALLPRLLGDYMRAHGGRLIHFSTDGVFDGRLGGYAETAMANPVGEYAVSKYLGEVSLEQAVTLRLSLVGFSLGRDRGLLDWFLGAHGEVKGYLHHWFTGLPVTEVARFVDAHMLSGAVVPGGIWHLAGHRISKFELLAQCARRWPDPSRHLVADSQSMVDRSLNGLALAGVTGYRSVSWDRLLGTMQEFYARAGVVR